MHGKGSKQEIKRMTFRQLLTQSRRLLIPLYQRRYCWADRTIWHWFEDVVRGKRDHLGIHNTGNVILKRSPHNKDALIVIDGQQRITTTMLFLSALSDELQTLEIESFKHQRNKELWNKVDDELTSLMFINESQEHSDSSKIEEGEDINSCRLLPSFSDRKPFFQMLLKPTDKLSEDTEAVSFQKRAKEGFKSRIAQELRERNIVAADDKIDFLSEVTHQALDLMGVTYVEIINEINMAQVFLWLQEKSLFGEASLLFNPTPGNYFTAVDMIRNLLVSPTMELSFEEQEKFYRDHWLQPIENSFKGDNQLESFNTCLQEFINSKKELSNFSSEGELTYLKMMKASTSLSPIGRQYITTYAKFISLFEKISLEMSEKDTEVQKTEAEKSQRSLQKHLYEASLSILTDISTFISMKQLETVKAAEKW